MAKVTGSRSGAILWLVASALSFVAALLTYISDHQIKWTLLSSGVLMAALGVAWLRRSKSGDAA